MKKFLVFVLCAVLLTGCAQGETESITSDIPETVESTKDTVESLSETVLETETETEVETEAETEAETESEIEELRSSPEKWLEQYLEEYLNQDVAEMPYNFTRFFETLTYKTTVKEENANTAIVIADITSHDLSTVFEEVVSEVFVSALSAAFSGMEYDSEAETARLLEEKLLALDYPIITRSVTVYMEFNGTEWQLTDGKNDDLLFALMGGLLSQEQENTETQTEAETTENILSAPAAEAVSEIVILDEAGIKITVKSLDKSAWIGPELKLQIENNTDKNLIVQAQNTSVNDYMVNATMSTDVAAGKKANTELSFFSSSIETVGIDTFAKIEFNLHIMDDNWDTYLDTDVITVKTTAFDTYTQTYDDSGVEVFSSNGIRVVSKGLNTSDTFDMGVVFYVYNGSDQSLVICDQDCSVNGFMLDPNLYVELAPGKHAVDTMDFFSSDLEENEITEINEVEFVLRAYNSNTWDDITVSEPITLNFN